MTAASTDPERLAGLADRCEAASGPDEVLDMQIMYALSIMPDRADPAYPRYAYTASLDAAMTLATGFVLLHLSDIGADGLPLCTLGDPGTTPTGEWTGIASRLELAICAAALRARAHQETRP